ncbi:L-serine ammonia-lyase, iron-sulfur-dependent subunit beta [Clostridia bacterium]|nr:L-serine ammonia-lyase, iron-sulfur-dependent subunit beta [Clostridia bacterium]
MKDYSLYDILGPIMIGPSSSHTAGACRIGYMTRNMIKRPIVRVQFDLYGSFAKTYRGHGTDIALLGGILGFAQDDERIVSAYEIAKEQGLENSFVLMEDDDEHPNTVVIKADTDVGKHWVVKGISIGGGKVVIKSINGIDVDYTGEYNTILTHHTDSPGMLALITALLAEQKINIANMRLYREEKGKKAICIIENDEAIPEETVKRLQIIQGMHYVNIIDRIYE